VGAQQRAQQVVAGAGHTAQQLGRPVGDRWRGEAGADLFPECVAAGKAAVRRDDAKSTIGGAAGQPNNS
jgi:hypothetical protein